MGECEDSRLCLEALNKHIDRFNRLVQRECNEQMEMHQIIVMESLRKQQLLRAEENLNALFDRLNDQQQQVVYNSYTDTKELLHTLREEHAAS